MDKECPHCKIIANGQKEIDELFGMRIKEKKYILPQSWCKDCRKKAIALRKQNILSHHN